MAQTAATSIARKTHAAFTLIELLVGMAITAVLMAGVGVISMTLQRSFVAADYQMTAQNDQLRVLDYVARDLHMASALTILNGGAKLSLTLPSSSSSSGSGTISLNLAPPLNSLLVAPSDGSTATQTVAYYVEGGQFIREVNGVQTVLASTVSDVTFTRQDPFVTTSVLFTPQFSLDQTAAAQEPTRATGSTYLLNMMSGN